MVRLLFNIVNQPRGFAAAEVALFAAPISWDPDRAASSRHHAREGFGRFRSSFFSAAMVTGRNRV